VGKPVSGEWGASALSLVMDVGYLAFIAVFLEVALALRCVIPAVLALPRWKQ
jgi:hypothetical protein